MDEQINQQITATMPVEQPPKRSMKKLFIILGAVVILAVIGVVAFFLMRDGAGEDVSVAINAPEQVQSGVPFDLQVNVSNDADVLLKDTQILINLPNEFVFTGPAKEVFENRRVGTLEPGRLIAETFKIIPMSSENTIKQVRVVVSYVPGSLSSRFEKVQTKDIVVSEPGVVLDIIPPTSVFGGEEFETEVTYRNNSDTELKNSELRVFYPSGFTFISAAPEATGSGHNIWTLGDIAVGGEGSVKLRGSLLGQSGAVFEFKLNLSADAGSGVYTVSEKNATVTLAASPLALSITVNNDPDLIVSPGQQLSYKLIYANNTEIALSDVVIKAKLEGEMFDLKTIKSDGVLGTDNSVTWNASRVAGLRTLAAGQNGFVEFFIFTKPDYPITRLSSKNFTLKVTASIESPTVPRAVAGSKIVAAAVSQTKVRGRLTVDSLGFFRDAGSGILNSGALPPRVGQATQYTIHWKLKNYSTDVDQVTVRAYLGPNVRFTGQAKQTIGSLAYNDRNQEMVWTVGGVPATRGILSPAYEAIFQIELTPAIYQQSTFPVLIQDTTVTYHDVFTDETNSAIDSAVTTQLPDDATLDQNQKMVQP